MFKLTDFPLGSFLYVIDLGNNYYPYPEDQKIRQMVPTHIRKCKVFKIDKKDKYFWLEWHEPHHSGVFGVSNRPLYQHHIELPDSQATFFIPEFLYNAVHGIPNGPLTPSQTLMALMGTGSPTIDWVIKRSAPPHKDENV